MHMSEQERLTDRREPGTKASTERKHDGCYDKAPGCYDIVIYMIPGRVAILLPVGWFDVVHFLSGVDRACKYTRYHVAMDMGPRGIWELKL